MRDKIMPITQVKRELMAQVKALQARGGVIHITKDGSAAGVLMGAEEYDGLLETLEVLNDRSLVRSLNKALKDIRQGEVFSHKEVFGD